MNHLRLFEEWNKKRFASKEEQRDYYRKPTASIEERTYTTEQLKDFNIPDEIIQKMKTWEVIVKSPYSNTFYNSKDIAWGYKPDGSFRVSDHWNFEARDKKHCLTESPVTNTTHVSLGQYDRKKGKYKILLTLPKTSHLQRINLGRKKREFMMNPEIISQKKDFKSRIEKKEIIAEVTDKGKTYKGVVRKYTGRELKIENELGELIYNENYLENQIVKLFDRVGKSVVNPFDVKFESRLIKTFEGFNVSKLSNFSNEELEDLYEDFQDISNTYGLKDFDDTGLPMLAQPFAESYSNLVENGTNFYYINVAKNAFIEIFYFGVDKEEFIDDLKSFISKVSNLYGWKIINSLGSMYSRHRTGFPCGLKQNKNGEEYLEILLVFHKNEK
jgi:hypothetical protein